MVGLSQLSLVARGYARGSRAGSTYSWHHLFTLCLIRWWKIVPSTYARQARQAGIDLITWTLERSGPLTGGGGWYYQTVKEVISNDGDMMQVLDVLAQQVGVIGVFSDWPATTTYYANCMNLP